jgi:glyoxylase-like metal-dependent hydrolase (beta-lactamase superfamily II)
VTHLHNDHIGGEVALQQHLKETWGLHAPIAGHAATVADLRGKVEFQKTIEDGAGIRLTDAEGAGFDLEALHTPGHARGHLAFFDRELGFLLTGDNVVGTGTVVIAPPQGDMTEYLESLGRMRDLAGLRFLAGSHGAAVFDARGRIEQYIAHRLERERQVAEAFASGVTDAPGIAARIYAGLEERLFPLAVRTVEAHLARILGPQ